MLDSAVSSKLVISTVWTLFGEPLRIGAATANSIRVWQVGSVGEAAQDSTDDRQLQ